MKKVAKAIPLVVALLVFCLSLTQWHPPTDTVEEPADPSTITAPVEQNTGEQTDKQGAGSSTSNEKDSDPSKTSAPTNKAETDDGVELGEGISDGRAAQERAAKGVHISRDGTYTSKVEVALYLHTYKQLPDNFISKTKARKAGWDSSKGNLDEVCPGKSIGGSVYENESWNGEPVLPDPSGTRNWHECDINYTGGYRGAERIVFSDDGLIFYTADHYKTFERLY